jgi:quinoprotein glucose dehydrogenase
LTKKINYPLPIPSLAGVGDRLRPQQLVATIKNGKGGMPGFPNLTDDQMFALVDYLTSWESKELPASGPSPPTMKFRFNTGDFVWKIPLGEYPRLVAKGQSKTGTENYGGPIVPAAGLVFIGATNFDRNFRAFDKATGELLWETFAALFGQCDADYL